MGLIPPNVKKNCTIGIQRLPLCDAGDVETNAVFLYCVGKYRLLVQSEPIDWEGNTLGVYTPPI